MGAGASTVAEEDIPFDLFCDWIETSYSTSTNFDTSKIDIKATFDSYKSKETGLLSSKMVTELLNMTDVFLTHDWGADVGHSNHQRVSQVNDWLKAKGVTTWFDKDRLTGEVVDEITFAIENTKLAVVFVTKRYMEKVNSANPKDNCRKEFKFANSEKHQNT